MARRSPDSSFSRYSAGRCACCALNGISGQGKWAPQILLAQGQFGDLFFSSVIK